MFKHVVGISKSFIIQRRFIFVIGLYLLSGLVCGVRAETSSTDGTTPLVLTAGAPTGSYPLSDFDNINIFNGNLLPSTCAACLYKCPFTMVVASNDLGQR